MKPINNHPLKKIILLPWLSLHPFLLVHFLHHHRHLLYEPVNETTKTNAKALAKYSDDSRLKAFTLYNLNPLI